MRIFTAETVTPCNRISIKYPLSATWYFWNYCGQCVAGSPFPIVGGDALPIPWFYLQGPIKADAPHGAHLQLKNKVTPLHWKLKLLSRKWFQEQNKQKSGTVINTCVSLIRYKVYLGKHLFWYYCLHLSFVCKTVSDFF